MRLIACIALTCVTLFAADLPTATVDPSTTIVERFMGLGVQWDPYEYPPSEAAWKLTLARLDFMKPAFFRVICNAGNPRPPYLFKILDYAQSRGIDVMLGQWNPPKDPNWPAATADFVRSLIQDRKYTVIRYYNFFNEPNGNWMWPQGKVDYDAWAAGLRQLRQEFDAHGLQSLPIAGPDNSGDWEWLDRCAQELRGQIGFWEMHWYVKDKELLDGDIEKLLRSKREMLQATDPQLAAKNLYMGEAGIITGRVNGDQQPRVKDYDYGVLMADFIAQVARAGWMGASAWDLDDAMHVVNGRPHTLAPDDLTLKIWGFWNTQARPMGHPEDESIRPWFYTWSLMSRLFPKGARIVQVNETNFPPGLRTMATADTLMIVNDSDGPQALLVRGVAAKKFTRYDYFASDRPTNKNGFPIPLKKKTADMQVALPARGVVFLTR